MNADTTEILEATQGTPLGANLFAYCNNNPVNMTDPMGTMTLASAAGFIVAFGTIVFLLILIYSITFAITGTIGNAESKYYSPGAFLQSLCNIYLYIQKNKELLITALCTSAWLALVKGFNGNTVEHHIIAQSSWKAQIARDFYNDVGGDVQDLRNKVTIKEVFHWFLHTEYILYSYKFTDYGKLLFSWRIHKK